MIMNFVSLIILTVTLSVSGQSMKEAVENNLIPFEYFVGTVRENETKSIVERMEHWFVPGISVAVINDYQLEWADGYGEAQNGVPATADTIYQAGTISSFLSALTALKYVENGTLNLETNINDYLTSTWKMSYKRRRDNRVKLKHLLSHSGAVTVDRFDGYTRGQILPTLQQTLSKEGPANSPKVELIEDLLDIIFNDAFTPGTQEDYSSGGFAALQQVLEDVTGQSFRTIVQQLVLDKAGMSSSSFAIRDYTDTNDVAFGHHCNSSEENVIPGNWNTYPESAAQGLWSNVGDLAKLLINVAKGKRGDAKSILNTQSTNSMLTIQLKNGQGNPKATEDGTFGLGTEVVDGRASSKWFFNAGYSEGYCSEIIGNTDGRGLVMMSNLDCERSHFLLGEVFRAVAAAYRWEDAASAKVDFNTRLPVKLPLESPQPWEGLYKVEPYDTGIPGVGVIQPFQTVYFSANTAQVDQDVCISYMYPCANLDNVYCTTLSIFQDVEDKLGQFTFTPDGASGYKGELYLGVVPIVVVEVKIVLTRISESTRTFSTTTNTPAGVSTTMGSYTSSTIGAVFMSCKCVLNIIVNSTNCTQYNQEHETDNTIGNNDRDNTSDRNCESAFPVQDLGRTNQLVQAGCEGCLQMLRSCPRECLRQARSYWGTEGLYRLIVTDTPWGPREKRVGQAFCERYYSSIPPPGVDIISKHIINECQEEFFNFNFYSKLCCAMLDIPVVGRVPIWDYNCNGVIENDEEIMANIMN